MFLLNTSCIHSGSVQTKDVVVNEDSKFELRTIVFDDFEIQSIVFQKSKLPLEDFFSKLMKGEFKDSILNLNLKYRPSNVDNEALRKLLDFRFVPVYVKIKNNYKENKIVSYKDFTLFNLEQYLTSLGPEALPNKFTQDSEGTDPDIVLQNVGETILLLPLILLLAVILPFPGMILPESKAMRERNKKLSIQYKNTEKIDYKNLLLDQITIEPNKEYVGLLFFRAKENLNSENLNLQFQKK